MANAPDLLKLRAGVQALERSRQLYHEALAKQILIWNLEGDTDRIDRERETFHQMALEATKQIQAANETILTLQPSDPHQPGPSQEE